ncbi:phosphotransferase enzyme family protein [Streptomyces sp. TLI_171]|uniref:phosphotransferase enzyme family protein n=1 Tax=Streptomyces sp. TLI_171 TaxID=1938859 RepID=UPI000C17CC09|nr:phosphotransferase [Streptomyces sp. TLI_171]RKE20251.1 Ser/Thr protein kinase RdoA (MazF antagonist) [Streptomyces sp. TLI_171]
MTDGQTISLAPARPDATAPPVGTLSAPVAHTAVAGVLRAYRTAPPTAVTPVAEGLLNRGYRIATADGDWFLKCYVDRATAGRPAITAQHRATTALAALGLPVPAPLANRDGRTVTTHGGRLFALYPWVAGGHRHGTELDPVRCGELGGLLGALHGALARVCPPLRQPDGVLAAEVEETERIIAELRALARAHRPRSAFDRLAEDRLTERLDLLATHRHRRPGPTVAPRTGWTHGDFHGLNVLYRGDAVTAVLDWDKLAPHPVAEEAVRAATLLFNDRATGVLDLVRVRHWTRAYRATGAADAEQVARAVHRVWWERLNDLWMLQWRYQRRDHRADPLFPASAGQLAWWCQEYEQVLDAFVN